MKTSAYVAGAALIAVASAASAQALPPGPPITIQAVTQVGPQLPQYTKVDVPLLREGLPKKSGGRISVTLASWPERNLTGPEIIRLVRSGQVDIAAVPLNTVSGEVPMLDMVDLAGLNPTVGQARKVAQALLPELNKELERFNTRIVAMYPFAAQVFFCRDNVASLADLKGKRVRTAGGSSNTFVASLGAQPTAIGFPEVYAALERGVVDCAITGSSSGNGARWYEVSQSQYALPLFWSVSMYVVNLSWWNRLDPAVRGLLEGTMGEVEAAQWALGAETTEDGLACNSGDKAGCRIGKAVETKPMALNRPVAADQEALRATLTAAILPAFMERCGARCVEVYNRAVAPISGVSYGPK